MRTDTQTTAFDDAVARIRAGARVPDEARALYDVHTDEATFHEYFLPHFRQAVDAGAAAVMSAYNAVDGEWAGQNPMLLTTVLRDDWGFTGTVITDFIWGMRDGTVALRAGLDVEAPFREQRATHLAADLAAGRARWDDVERAALRTLGTSCATTWSGTSRRPTPRWWPGPSIAPSRARSLRGP